MSLPLSGIFALSCVPELRPSRMRIFDESCEVDTLSIRSLRQAFQRRLTELRIPADLADDLTLATAEVITNVVQHSDPKATSISVQLSVERRTFQLAISDDGGSFAAFETLAETAQLDSDLTESGRGIALVQASLNRVTYAPGAPNWFRGWRDLVTSRPNILIIEDEPALLDLYHAMLAERGRVLTASSLIAGLQIAQQQTIDLIVSDYHLTDGSGAGLLDRLEASSDTLPTPVIILTGDKDPSIRRRLLELGAEDILYKPINLKSLTESVDLAFRRAARRRLQYFRHVGSLVGTLVPGVVPTHSRGFEIFHVGRTAEIGGGDRLLHLTAPGFDRLVLIDVMGHGLSAARGSLSLDVAIRTAHSFSPTSDCGGFLSHFSYMLWSDAAFAELISTMLVIDLHADGRVRVASAGHPAPLLLNSAGLRVIEVAGPLLGLFRANEYVSEEIELEAGERLLLITDGVDPVAIGAGGELPSWFEASACRARLSNAPDLLHQISRDIAARGVPADDWTLAVVERPARPAAQ
jgi:DNA-binding response OmpR family regulator/anti-sigma regulatory factor (Ser/Thr protein kinase)